MTPERQATTRDQALGEEIANALSDGAGFLLAVASLLRQYFPKGVDISEYSRARLNAVARKLNERPTKALDFRAPAEMYDEVIASTG